MNQYTLNLKTVLFMYLITSCMSLGRLRFQEMIEDYSRYPVGGIVGSVAVQGCASASQPVVQSDVGASRYLSVSIDIGPGLHRSASAQAEDIVLEAEDAEPFGWIKVYLDAKASAGKAVSGFGDLPFSHAPGTKKCEKLTFEEVPFGTCLTVWYINGSDETKVCGLYINDARVATLEFQPTGSWISEYHSRTYEGYVWGKVELISEEQDFAVNHNQVPGIIDRLVVGRRIWPKGMIDLSIPLSQGSIDVDDKTISFPIRAPRIPFTIELEDAAGNLYKSVLCRAPVSGNPTYLSHYNANRWDRYTIQFHDLEPAVPDEIKPLISKIHLRLQHENSNMTGQFDVGPIITARGWPSTPPPDCPFELSEHFVGVEFPAQYAHYTEADTWYPSWGQDDHLYSCWTDGFCNGLWSRSDGFSAMTGSARIVGTDPMQLEVFPINLHSASSKPLGSRYPCANLIYNGVWYIGTYDAFWGPFVGFHYSTDVGQTWQPSPRTPTDNLFGVKIGEDGTRHEPTRIGAPHVVDFGKNMEHSPDGKAYMVAHGSSQPDPNILEISNWILGDEIHLVRVKPSIENINELSAYEFFAGYDDKNNPIWAGDIKKIKPLFTWKGKTGCVTATYNPVLKKYLMCVTTGYHIFAEYDTYILESDRIEGPYRLISYMEAFGRQAYFVNIPTKFIGEDGTTLWLCYAANYMGQEASPKGSSYGMHLQKLRLIK